MARDEVAPGVRIAALQCLVALHTKQATLGLSSAALAAFSGLRAQAAAIPQAQVALWEGALLGVKKVLAAGEAPGANWLEALKGSGPYESYARLLLAAHRGQDEEVAMRAGALMKEGGSLPASIESQRDSIQILWARAHYNQGRYVEAAREYRKLKRGSNDLAHSLSELAWAELMAGRRPEAIGVGIGTQSGWMKRTFNPEALMVTAMALNEICRYPEALGMIARFKNEYRASYLWLRRLLQPGAPDQALYGLATQFVRSGKSPVPERVMSEWISSPVFIARQEGINGIIRERKAIVQQGQLAQSELKMQAQRIVEQARRLRAQYAKAKILMKPGDQLPDAITRDWQDLKTRALHYRRMVRAAPVWKAVLQAHRTHTAALEKRHVALIEDEFYGLSERMLRQLNQVAENNDLIEVEILDGASQDMIWKNAHPEYTRTASRGARKAGPSRDPAAYSEEVYSWGETASSLSASGEVWEDEIDGLKANLADRCANQEKYLGVGAS